MSDEKLSVHERRSAKLAIRLEKMRERQRKIKEKLTAKKRIRSQVQYIYFVRAGEFVKIGWATNMGTRISAIDMNIPHHIEVLATLRGGYTEEQLLHGFFRKHHHKGEWFEYAPELQELVALIKDRAPIAATEEAARWVNRTYGWKAASGLRNIARAAAQQEDSIANAGRLEYRRGTDQADEKPNYLIKNDKNSDALDAI